MAETLFWIAIGVCCISLALSAPSRLNRKMRMSKKQYDYYSSPDPYNYYNDYSGSGGYYDPYNDYSGSGGYYDPYNDYSGSGGYNDYSGSGGYYDPYYDYSGSGGYYDPYYDYSGSSGYYDPFYGYSGNEGYSGNGDQNLGSCGYGQMQCIDKQCVDVNNICDGMWSCNKGEDELFCSDYYSTMMYYKKMASKRNVGKPDEKMLKIKAYNEVRKRHAKQSMIARRRVKTKKRGKTQRAEDELRQLLMRTFRTDRNKQT